MAHEPDLLPDFAEAIANIVVAAGYKEGPALAHRRILSRFSESIGTVMKLARNLNKKVGEGVTSCDLEALYIRIFPSTKLTWRTRWEPALTTVQRKSFARQILVWCEQKGYLAPPRTAQTEGHSSFKTRGDCWRNRLLITYLSLYNSYYLFINLSDVMNTYTWVMKTYY